MNGGRQELWLPEARGIWNESSCYITELFVKHAARGRGHGKKMLNYMEKRLKKAGCKEVKLLCGPLESGQPPASEFYRKQGYKHKYPKLSMSIADYFGWSHPPIGGLMTKML